MSKATIKDLTIQGNQRLTGDMKRAFVKIVEDEFHNQTSTYHSQKDTAENEAREAFKKIVGVDKYKSKIAVLQSKITELTVECKNKGWNMSSGYGEGPVSDNPTWKKLVDSKVAPYSIPRSNKNKLITRLWMATTVGEANVILQEVMGNDILPTMSKSEVKLLSE